MAKCSYNFDSLGNIQGDTDIFTTDTAVIPENSYQHHFYVDADVRTMDMEGDYYEGQRNRNGDSFPNENSNLLNSHDSSTPLSSYQPTVRGNGFRNYGSTAEMSRSGSFSETTEDELMRSSFHSSRRVRHCSGRNASVNYTQLDKSAPDDDILSMNIESLNFDSKWKLELDLQKNSSKAQVNESRDSAQKEGCACLPRCLKLFSHRTAGFIKSYFQKEGIEYYRFFVCSLIGVCVALLTAGLLFLTDRIVYHKHRLFASFTDLAMQRKYVYGLLIPGWVLLNVMIAAFGSILVYQIEPRSAGSGVPELRAFINGLLVPRVVRCHTLLARLLGMVVAPVADLPLGEKEPLMYVGGAVAAGLSQGRASSFSFDCRIFKRFRDPAEKRDLVTAGAAAGFCAAFGTPVSAVLFMMEEMSTFWTQAAVWRVMWTSIVASVTMAVVRGAWTPAEAGIGAPMFGIIKDSFVPMTDVWLGACLGLLGGLLGVLFGRLNRAVNRVRARCRRRGVRVLEVMLLSAVCASTCLPMLWVESEKHCRPLHTGNMAFPVGLACPQGQTNSLGMLLLQLPSKAFRALVHEPMHIFQPWALLLFCLYMTIGNAVLYGCNLAGGVIMPNFVIGATWGRLLGHLFISAFGASPVLSIEKFAVFGAAAQTAGVLRSIVTIPVMFVEATQSIQIGLVLAVTCLFAKITADAVCSLDFYSVWTRLMRLPYLPEEPDDSPSHLLQLEKLKAADIMSRPVTFVRCTETVRNLLDILKKTPHNGFPVVSDETGQDTFGRLRGFVDRQTLLTLLEHKDLYSQDVFTKLSVLTADTFRRPRAPNLQAIEATIRESEMDLRIVVAEHMSIAPHVVQSHMTYMRVYHMFRTLGLRHLTVVSIHNRVVGIITRKDLRRYRCTSSFFDICRPGRRNEMYECDFVETFSDSE